MSGNFTEKRRITRFHLEQYQGQEDEVIPSDLGPIHKHLASPQHNHSLGLGGTTSHRHGSAKLILFAYHCCDAAKNGPRQWS
jgi:hypothetical protein